jgi:HNH endonuclease
VKIIRLSRGEMALVPDEWFEELNKHKWHAQKGGHTLYAASRVKNADGRSVKIYMHRVILNAPKGVRIDHIDGNGLNNQLDNLRFATHAENEANRGKNKNNKSGFKGVSWSKRRRKWLAQIGFEGKQINLGCRYDIYEAVKLRNDAALKLHGKFAVLETIP